MTYGRSDAPKPSLPHYFPHRRWRLAAPEFGPRRLYANLGQAAGGPEDKFAVIWNPAD